MKKCFTITALRTAEDFQGYQNLLREGTFSAIEIFFPSTVPEQNAYKLNVQKLLFPFPGLEVIMHLPFGKASDLCDWDHLPETISKMKAGMDFGAPFQVKKLTLHLGFVKKAIPREEYLARITETLKDLCDYAEKLGMTVMIENMPTEKELGYSPEEILDIIVRTGKPNLKFIFDIGHAHVASGLDLAYLSVLKDYLCHLHLSDNHGVSDEHRNLGFGTVDFLAFFSKLREIGYDQTFCLEILHKSEADLRSYAAEFDRLAALSGLSEIKY
jgi:sugar phosphate isomerase/epimerase